MTSRAFCLSGDRPGFSLLEVLVACGILVIGLASIAAILPAAGSRLGEASAQDRAAAAAVAAMTEIRCRSLASRDIFPGPLSGTAPAIVFGETLSLAVTTSATSLGYSSGLTTTGTSLSFGTTPILSAPNTGTLATRIHNNTDLDDRRGYFLEDEVPYQISTTGGLPLNSFVNGVRRFNRGVCWGAMVTPVPWGVTTGSMTAVRASVAVFRKPGGAATAMTLRLTSGTASGSTISGVFSINNVPGTLQRTLLKSCSSLLAIPPSGTTSTGPQWLTVQSSWLSGANPLTTSSTTANVVFSSPVSLQLSNTTTTPWTLSVIAFENLLLVNEQALTAQ